MLKTATYAGLCGCMQMDGEHANLQWRGSAKAPVPAEAHGELGGAALGASRKRGEQPSSQSCPGDSA